MKLEDLAGVHNLDAVDFTNEKVETWSDQFNDCQAVRFRLDGICYMAIEDPEDGYRSCMKELVISTYAGLINIFAPIEVIGVYKDKSDSDEWNEEWDILQLIDTKTNNIVLEVGTKNTDDYYPYFVAEFSPQNMSINNV